jgi:hypothetical protein
MKGLGAAVTERCNELGFAVEVIPV